MAQQLKEGMKVSVDEWGEGIIIGSCPWGAAEYEDPKHLVPDKLWLVKITQSGKIVSVLPDKVKPV